MTQSDGLLKKTGKRLDLRLETEGETEGRRGTEEEGPTLLFKLRSNS